MKRFALLAIACTISWLWSTAQIGTWKAYQAYSDITDIQPAERMIYVLTSNALYAYHKNDKSIQTFDKSTHLSDVNIAKIAYNRNAKRLLIVYRNNNIDLLDANGNVINMPDYYNKLMAENKTVNSVIIHNNDAYLATGFGIIKINMRKAEISDTYYLKQNILSVAIVGNTIYAYTNNQVLKADLTTNLLDNSNWTSFSNIFLMRLFNLNGKLIGIDYSDLYEFRSDGTFSRFYNAPYKKISLNDQKLVCYGNDHFDVINSTTDCKRYTGQYTSMVYDATQQAFWASDEKANLQLLSIDNNNGLQTINIDIRTDGPKYNYFGFMKYANETLYTCNGGYSPYGEQHRSSSPQILNKDGNWTVYEDNLQQKTGHKYEDNLSLDVDPGDATHVFVGGKTGLYEFKNGMLIEHYNIHNSPLQSALPNNNTNYVLIESIKFDLQGNLFMLNSQAKSKSIVEFTKDRKWISHHKSALMGGNGRSLEAMQGLILDSRNLFWFVNMHWDRPWLICYDAAADTLIVYDKFVNQDGKTINVGTLLYTAEDFQHNIWIATNTGPLILKADQVRRTNDIVFEQVKIPRNDGTHTADYLLNGVYITCIAIDGAGRKWLGTKSNGAYLISEDNMTQLQHFTAENSKLLSDQIESIAINNATGEVFFGTSEGLCSYMSDASGTNNEMLANNIYAYPNPVEPDYTGLITVTGLTLNADVRIVTSHGALVAQGKSNGGLFTWDGNDLNGKRVASGIYIVLAATNDGRQGPVCKIAIVR